LSGKTSRKKEAVSLPVLEFLAWVSLRPRTYGETMEAWRSSCPRLSVWEDALADGLIRVESGANLDESRVTVTDRGRALLDRKN
jgi:hypothetical protein